MYTAPQIEPVTAMARNHKSLLKKLKDGPVYLTQRGNEAAVMISAEEWRMIVKQLNELQQLRRQARLERSNAAYAAMMADPTQMVDEAEYQQMLTAAGLAR
jgi:prevent-host-death family protein